MASIRRATSAVTDATDRAAMLPAFVEIALAAGELEEARVASKELDELAARLAGDVVHAKAALARGALLSADGDHVGALRTLRGALDAWQRLGAPYFAARARVMIARACGSLGDGDAERMELDAARTVLERLGAPFDDGARRPATAASRHRLSARELEVLRLVATGKTNKSIANALFLSVKTVDRHVSNLFAKLHVRTRSAATAYAYENRVFTPADR